MNVVDMKVWERKVGIEPSRKLRGRKRNAIPKIILLYA